MDQFDTIIEYLKAVEARLAAIEKQNADAALEKQATEIEILEWKPTPTAKYHHGYAKVKYRQGVATYILKDKDGKHYFAPLATKESEESPEWLNGWEFDLKTQDNFIKKTLAELRKNHPSGWTKGQYRATASVFSPQPTPTQAAPQYTPQQPPKPVQMQMPMPTVTPDFPSHNDDSVPF
jgi:hypothetical protein